MHAHNRIGAQRQVRTSFDEHDAAQRYMTCWTLYALHQQYERESMQLRRALRHYPCRMTGIELQEDWALQFESTAARFQNSWLLGNTNPAANFIGTAARHILYVDAGHPAVTCGGVGFSIPTAPNSETGPTPAREAARTVAPVGALRVQRLARIQAAFGFPIKVLAEILRRSRTQMYKWLDPEEAVDLQGESLQRMQRIASMAERWLTESAAPLDSIAREPLPSGGTIVELLSAAELDEEAIAAGFKYLADLTKAKPQTLSQQLAARGFGRRKITLPDDD